MYIKILFYVEQKCLFYQDMWKKYLILVAFILGKKKQFLNNILQFFFSMKYSQIHSCDHCKIYGDLNCWQIR